MTSLESSLSSPVVAVDVGGADAGVSVMVEGAVAAYKELGLSSILVGNKDDIVSAISALGATDFPLLIEHAPSVISMEDSPSRAVRRKSDSSMCTAYRCVQNAKAHAVISAGNSGAMMVAGAVICGLMPGIERPAIAAVIPVVGDSHPTVLLDVGANIECSALNLVQFSIMGRVYCSSMFSVSNPKIGLLSNGSESSKGTDLTRRVSSVLSRLLDMNYIGYVEGRDICAGGVDVVVCDGFVGNAVLKAMEGCARMIGEEFKLEARRGIYNLLSLAIARPVIKGLFARKFDYSTYGGAPLLGVKKLALVLHGSCNVQAVKSAVKVACDFVNSGMLEKLNLELEKLDDSFDDVGAMLNVS